MSLNDGGPVVRVSKEPVEKPTIRRGLIQTVLMPQDVMHGGDIMNGCFEEVTLVTRSECDRFRITYHRAQVLSFAPEFKEIRAAVHPDTVVTWDRL